MSRLRLTIPALRVEFRHRAAAHTPPVLDLLEPVGVGIADLRSARLEVPGNSAVAIWRGSRGLTPRHPLRAHALAPRPPCGG